MSKIRMNTELRNKLFNKIKDVFENEDTQEREAFLQSREDVDKHYIVAHDLAKEVVERSYPVDDVATLRHFKKKYGQPCDVVAKDKCFYFAHSEDVDDEGETTETKSHFDFGLFGNLNGSEYSSDEGKKFAVAYYREELKAKDCNPDIYAQQSENKDNPHKTKHVDKCMEALGHSSSSRYNSDDNAIGMERDFNNPYYVDVIGTSYCRSRAIACTKDEYGVFEEWRIAKGNLVSKHQTWIDTIQKQCDQLKIGLKAYRYLSEGIELATELGIQVDEAELIRTNSTGLVIYNPTNCGLIGKNAAVEVDGAAYWMSENGFFRYTGKLESLPCLVEDHVFDDINTIPKQHINAGLNNLFGEVMWFYPNSGSGTVNRVVTYNYLDSSSERPVWTVGTLARTAWQDSAVFGKPHATEYDDDGTTATTDTNYVYGNTDGTSTYYEHETGLNQIKDGATSAITASIESGDFDIGQQGLAGDGEFMMKIRRVIPDFLSQTGDARITLNLRDFPNDTSASSTLGPFTVTSGTQKIDTRARARSISLKVDNTSTSQFWKLGTFRLDYQPDGRR